MLTTRRLRASSSSQLKRSSSHPLNRKRGSVSHRRRGLSVSSVAKTKFSCWVLPTNSSQNSLIQPISVPLKGKPALQLPRRFTATLLTHCGSCPDERLEQVGSFLAAASPAVLPRIKDVAVRDLQTCIAFLNDGRHAARTPTALASTVASAPAASLSQCARCAVAHLHARRVLYEKTPNVGLLVAVCCLIEWRDDVGARSELRAKPLPRYVSRPGVGRARRGAARHFRIGERLDGQTREPASARRAHDAALLGG